MGLVNIMKNILSDQYFNYIGDNDRTFLISFDKEMCDLGYERKEIGDFARWGNYKVAYMKPKVKAKTYISTIFFDGRNILLRLYFRNIDKHANYIETASNNMKEAFINDEGKCEHCSVGGCVKPDGSCMHRKTYIIDGSTYEKCDGKVFYFHNYDIESLSDYISLITEFYPVS